VRPSRHPATASKGDTDKLSKEWRDRILLEKERRGWSYRKLAEEARKHAAIKVSPAALHKLLTTDEHGGSRQRTSSFVAALSSLLGVPAPTVANPELTETPDPREVAMLSAFRRKSREEQDAFLLLLTGPLKPE
jgi:hypothetical protein